MRHNTTHLDISGILHHQRSIDLLLGGYKPEVQLTSNFNVSRWRKGLHKHNERGFVAENINMVAVLLQLQWSEYNLDVAWAKVGAVQLYAMPHACTHVVKGTFSGQLMPGLSRNGSGNSMLKALLAVCL